MDHIQLSSAPRQVMGCQRHLQSSILHPDRIMNVHDLICLIKGQWEITLQGQAYTLQAGDFLLLPAGAWHAGRRPSSPDCETMYVHFSALQADRLLPRQTALPAPTSDVFVLPAHIPGAPASAMQQMREIIAAYWSQDIYAQVRADACLALLLAQLTSHAFRAGTMAEKEDLVSKLTGMMALNEDRFYAAQELSQACGVSARTLQKYFHDTLGTSIWQYQLSMKLERARTLLEADPSLTLNHVAERLGFCDGFHLSKRYKKYYGHSPRKHEI